MLQRVILSSNESPKYIDYWPIVSWAWTALFGVKVSLAFVTERSHEDEYVNKLREYGDEVVIFPEVPGIPSPNNAKMARHYLASTHANEICMVADVDILPLQTAYYYNYLNNYKPGCLLINGKDAYVGSSDEGKFPIYYTTAEGRIFKEILNPNSLNYVDFLKSFIGTKVFDHKEDISISTHHEDADTFSDESLWRVLLSKWANNSSIIHIPRGFNPYEERGVSRSKWEINDEKLKNGTYVSSHLLRPYFKYKNEVQPLIDHIERITLVKCPV